MSVIILNAILFIVAVSATGKEPIRRPLGKIIGQPITAIKKPAPVFPVEQTCSEPSISCPVGYSLEGKACAKEVVTPSDRICSAGTLHGEECLTQVGTMPHCEDNYALRGDLCVKPIDAPRIPFCPSGFSDTGKSGCSKQVPAPVVGFCSQGRREDESCIIINTSAPRVTSYCPPNFDQEDNECCRIETYDCTPPGAGPLDCSDGDELCLKSKGHRNLHGKAAAAPVEITKEIAVLSQTCQRKITTQMLHDTSCDVGELIGGRCIMKQYLPLEHRCTGEGDKDNCFNIRHAPYEYSCPEGFTMAGAICRSQLEVAAERICPTGFMLSGSACIKSIPATPVCRVGVMDQSKMCVDVEWAPATTTWCVTCTGTNCSPAECQRSRLPDGKAYY